MRYLILVSLAFIGCTTCRGVIGASYDHSNHVVDYTLDDSPAAKIGLHKGDVLVDIEKLIGAPGRHVTVDYIRLGVEHRVDTDLVCIDDINHWYQ